MAMNDLERALKDSGKAVKIGAYPAFRRVQLAKEALLTAERRRAYLRSLPRSPPRYAASTEPWVREALEELRQEMRQEAESEAQLFHRARFPAASDAVTPLPPPAVTACAFEGRGEQIQKLHDHFFPLQRLSALGKRSAADGPSMPGQAAASSPVVPPTFRRRRGSAGQAISMMEGIMSPGPRKKPGKSPLSS